MLGVSERFAYRVTGQHRATQRHEPAAETPEDPDAALRAWLRQYAKNHPRRGRSLRSLENVAPDPCCFPALVPVLDLYAGRQTRTGGTDVAGQPSHERFPIMAHELDITNGVASFANSRADAWHRLGQSVGHTMTAREALAASHLADWNVRKMPLIIPLEPVIHRTY